MANAIALLAQRMKSFKSPALFARTPDENLSVPSWANVAEGEDDRAPLEKELFDTFARFRKRDPHVKTSRYIGVHHKYDSGRWEAQIRIKGKAMSVGKFSTEKRAARARDIVALWAEVNAPSCERDLNFSRDTYTEQQKTIKGATLKALLRTMRNAERDRKTPPPSRIFSRGEKCVESVT